MNKYSSIYLPNFHIIDETKKSFPKDCNFSISLVLYFKFESITTEKYFLTRQRSYRYNIPIVMIMINVKF